MDSDYLKWAEELKNLHPEILYNYTVEEVCKIWRDYSHDLAAHWISHEGTTPEGVQRVFSKYHLADNKILKEIE